MKTFFTVLVLLLSAFGLGVVQAAVDVPTDIQQPGTQPNEIGNLESPNKCDNCHGGYNQSVEPAHNWRGSMMAHAGRDPIFWATVAIAEQDFDGAGDLCIRCHSTTGWLAGRSTPTDGSGLAASDSDGVDCDFCHQITNTNNSEHLGVMNPPFIANCSGVPDAGCADPTDPPEGYYGSGMSSMWGGNEKLGPYSVTSARHQDMQSEFHRSVDFCGTCHDVSNPAVGNLAHNNGAQPGADPVEANGTPGGLVDGKAAFNNPPYKYGIVERTFSEYKSGMISQTLVSEYPNLPLDLQGGALQAGYESALVAANEAVDNDGNPGDYADGTPRYFSCQTCHMRPVNGPGCNKKGAPVRTDLPLHDMTGGNYWMPVAIQYLDSFGKLRLGGGLTATEITAMNDGIARAEKQLNQAATLVVTNNTLKVINHSGHKLISGYPEGRRMWLHITWYDQAGNIVREDGKYGPLVDAQGNPVTVPNPADPNGLPVQVESILDLHDANTTIYEAHMGMTKEWADQLMGDPFNVPAGFVLSYDRYTGDPDYTLGNLANQEEGTMHETFHFVLNNAVIKDNRIPPYGFDGTEARKRNALPVPAAQYGGNGADSTYNYWDEITLVPPEAPPSATYATIELLYQPTSWEYIQFLYLGNTTPAGAFLADEGKNMLDAWLNAGGPDVQMAKPYVMVSTVWGHAPIPAEIPMIVESLPTWSTDKKGNFVAPADTFNVRDTVGILAHVVDNVGRATSPLSGAQVFVEVWDAANELVISLQGFSDDTGNADMRWKTGRRQATGLYTATVVDVIKNGYTFYSEAGQTTVQFTLQ